MASGFARLGDSGDTGSGGHNDSPHPNHIIVPDAQLLFSANLSRSGHDLILTGDDGRYHTVRDYFANANRPILVAPNGESLSPDLIDLCVGSPSPGEGDHARSPIALDPIGRVQNVAGNVTVIRNGAAVMLNVGDAMFKSDVVKTGIDGLVTIVFVDGTRFQLYPSGHVVLHDCGTEKRANSALLHVAKGVFRLIAGKASTGRRVIDTPVGQIRNTASAAGFGSLAFSILTFGLIHELKAASADLTLLDNGTIDYKDLKHGVFEIVTKEAHPRRIVVDDPAETIVLRSNGSGTVSIEQVANSPVVMAQYQSAYQGTHDNFLRAQQDPFIQHFQLEQHANVQPTNNPGNTNTTATNTASTGSTGSSTPASVLSPTTSSPLIVPVQNNNAAPSIVPILAAAPVNELANNSPPPTTPTQQLVIEPPPTPTAAPIAGQTIGIHQTMTISGVSVSETGTTSGETFTVELKDSNGLLSASGATSGNNSTDLVIAGVPLSQLNPDLGTLTDTNSTPGPDPITLTATNSFGNSAASQTIAVVVNGSPVSTTPGPQTLGGGVAQAITGVSLSESGNTGGETFTVTLVDSNGQLTANTSGAGGGGTITGSGTADLVITGTLSQVNSDLGTLKDADGVAGPDTITLNASDSFGNGATAQTIAVTANGVPVITVPGAQTVALGMATAIAGVSLAESGTTSGESFTVTLKDSNGLLSANTSGAGGGGTITGSGTADLVITGTLSQVNADLGTLKDTDNSAGPDTITLTASDSFGNAATPATVAVTASVTPVITVPGAQTLGINQLTAISGISLAESGATGSETFTVTLVDSNGQLSATGGVQSNGGHTLTFTGLSLATLNSDLATLKDTDGTAGPDTITVNASDSFGNGATAQTIAVTANGVPVITVPGAQTVALGTATAIAGVSLAETGNTTGSESFTVTLKDSNGLLSASGATSGNNSTDLVITGTLSQVNADLGTLKDTDNSAGPDTITLTASDSFGNAATPATVAVTASVTPVITVPGAQTLGINQLTAISGISLAESGATGSETFTVTLVDSNGQLSANTSGAGGGGTITGSGTTDLIISGTLSQVNADLGTLKDSDGTATSGTPETITLTADDSFGNAATAKTIAVTVNGAPVIAVPGAQTVALGTATAIAGVSLAETGNTTGSESFTVTLKDSNGLLSASGATSGNNSTDLVITGTLSQVNADLGTLKDTDNSAGPDTITLTASDSFGNAATPATVAVTASVTPVITVPGAQTLGINQLTAISGISLAESGATGSETFTVTLVDSNGQLSANTSGAGGGGTITGSGTTDLIISGTLSQVNADLGTLKDSDGTATSGTPETITLTADDSFGNAATAKTIAVTVNGAPVIAVPGAQTVALGTATAIAGVSLAESGTTSGESFTVTLKDSNGLLSANTSGAGGGGTITGSGTADLVITGTLSQVNADLGTLKDTDNSAGPDTITLTASDSFGNAATPATVAVTASVTPVITVPGAQTLGINQLTAISGISLAESGATGSETFTVTLVDSNGQLSATGGVQSNGGHTLTFTGLSLTTLNSDLATLKDTDGTAGPDTITVNASDSFGNGATAQTIAVTANGVPVITVPGAQTVALGTATAIAGVSLAETGNTTGSESFTVTLKDSNGLLSASGATSGNNSTDLVITGTLSQVNADLGTLKDTDNSAGPDTITLTASDSFGNAATPATVAVTASVTPVITVPGAQTLGINQLTAISGISLAESGATGSETFTVTLVDSNGQLSATGGVQSNGGHTLTFTGLSLTTLNSDLATLKDTDGTAGPDTITVNASDSFGNGATAQTIAVTANGVPVITVPGAQTVALGTATAIAGVSLAETGNTTGSESFTVTLKDSNGLLSASGATSGNNSTDLVITGTLSQVNADLGTLKDTDNSAGPDTITLTASDSFGNAATPATVAVTASVTPVITVPGAQTLGINQLTAISGISLAESGATGSETFTVTLVDSNGQLSANTSGAGGGGTITGSGTTDLIISGTLSQVNADLGTLKDSDGTATSGTPETITLTADDSFGNAATAKTIAVTVNGAPVIAVPGAQTVALGTATAIAGVSLAESGNTTGSESFTVTLKDSNGLLSANTSGAGGGGTITGSGTADLVITGTLSQVNADLGTLKDTDNSAGPDTITLTASDSFGNAATPATVAVTASVTPVITVPGAQTLGINQLTAISGISLAESGATGSETFTVTLVDSNGQLSANTSGAGGGGTITGSGTTDLIISGTLSQVNADLGTLKDSDGTATSGTPETITLTADDSFGNAATAKTIAVTVNGAPVIAVPGAQTVALGTATAIAGVSLAESGNTTGSESFTVTLKDSNGLLSANTSGAGGGGTITGSGTADLVITGTLSQVNADLGTLKDTDNSAGPDTITLTASDSFGNAATPATVAVTASVTPVITVPGAQTLGINQLTAISGISLAESGATGSETFTVTLVDSNGQLSANTSGAGGGGTITGSGTTDLIISGTLSQVNADLGTLKDSDGTATSGTPETITLTADDSFGNAATAKTIAVTVNGAPVIAVPGAQTVALGTATAIAGVSLAETGNTTGSESFTVTLKDSNGLLSASGATSGNNSTDLVITGTLSQVNADLGTLKDTDNSAGPDTITLTASDSFGNAATPATVAVTASVTPVITVPGAQTLGINQLTAISGISLAESGATGSETFTVTLVDSNGQLSANTSGAGGGGTITGSGTTDLIISGTLSQVNADLGTLKDSDGTATSGTPETITLTADDSFGNAATAKTIAVTVNGAPVIAVPGAQTVALGTATAIAGVSLAESGNTTGSESFTVTLKDSNGLLSANTSGAGGGGTITGSGTADLVITGTLSQVNADLGTLKDTDNSAGPDTITLTASDSFGNAATPATVAVTASVTPVITVPGAQTLGINQLTAISGISLAESGATGSETFTVTLVDSNGQLSATGGVQSNGGHTLTFTGLSLATLNSDLATLKDTDGTAGPDTITVNASDSFGNGATAQTIAVTANGVPVITVPGAQTVALGTATAIAGVSLAETGNTTGSESFTVTLKDSNGLLSASGATSGNNSTDLVITGTLSQVNADLGTLKDTDNSAGPDTITLTASDSFGNAATPATVAVTASVTPVITVPGAQTLGINQLTAISGISLAESGATGSETFTVTLVDSNGQLSANTSGAGGGGTITGSGTTDLIISGTLSQVNADLGTLKDSDGTATSGTPETITLTADDSFGNAATAKTIAVTVNGAPVIAVPGAQTVALGTATAIAGVSLAESGTTSGESFTVTLKDSNGLLSANTSGAGGGGTITGSGTADLVITGTLSQVNADLGTLKDTDNSAGPDTITLTASDSFGNAATPATVAVTASVTPVITVPGAQTLGINQLTAISGISLAESGATGSETFTVTLVDSNGQLSATGGVQSNGGHTLTFTGLSLATLNSDLATLKDTDGTAGPDTITVNASDSFGNSATAQTIAVTANGVPVITVPGAQTLGINQLTAISGVSVTESGNTGGESFTATVTDSTGVLTATGGVQSNGGHTLTFTGLSLTILNSDLGTLKDADGTAGPDTITVNASDSFGNSATAQTIAVTANGVPVITVPGAQTLGINQLTAISGISLAESGATGSETFIATVTDSTGVLTATGGVQSNGGHTLTFTGLSLTTLNSDLATLKDTDGTAGPDTITVNASDSFGNGATAQAIAVTANGVPVITVPGAQTLGINQLTAISGISLAESGNTTGSETFTVTLVDSNGQLSATGGVQSNGGHTLTFTGLSLATLNSDLGTLKDTDGTAGPDAITVNASDSFGNSATAKTIAVTVNGAPVIAVPGAQTVALGTATAIAGVSLAETGNTTGSESFTVTLKDSNGLLSASGATSGNNSTDLVITGTLSQVNADLGTLKDTDNSAGPDTITLTASDSFGNAATPATVAVTANGVPVITVPGAQTIGQNQLAAISGISVTESGNTGGETFTATVTDSIGVLTATGGVQSNSGHTLTFTGVSLTTLNSDLGTLKDTDGTAGPDSITVNASDSFGNAATAATIAVTANGVPVITVPPSQTVSLDGTTTISGISVSEVGNTGGETFTATVTDSTGVLTATGGVQSNGGHTLTFTGLSLTTLNSDLGTLKDADGTAGPDTITVNASDSFGNVATAQTIAVTAETPANATPSSPLTVVENTQFAIGGLAVTDIASATDTAKVTLSVLNGILTALTGVPGGLIASSITGNGSSSVTLIGTQSAIDTTLAAANGITYQGNANFVGSDTLTMVSSDQSAGGQAAQSTVAINVTPALDPHLWANVNFPAQPTSGIHLFSPGLTVNASNDLVAFGIESAPNYNPANPGAPLQMTEQIGALDTFFLPQTIADPTIETTTVTPPTREAVILPNIQSSGGNINAEGIVFFVTQDANGNDVINEVVAGGGNNNDNTLDITPPVVVENAGQSVIFNIRSSFQQTNSVLSSYDLAWDQYNSSTQAYSINFQSFNASGGQLSGITTPVSLSGVPSITAAPAWVFGNGATAGTYLLGFAETDSTVNAPLNLTGTHQKLHFQFYNLNGTSSSLASFDIQPDLSHYAVGATNQIDEDLVPTLGAFAGGPSSPLSYGVIGSNYAIAWNETVTDAYGTHDQVEYVLDNGSTVIKQLTFQIGDGQTQNVRLATINIGGQAFEVLVYGDNTATNIIEFNSSGNQVAAIVDPTTQAYSSLASLGDGRIAISYDEPAGTGATSQYDFKIFDLRTAGININDSNTFTGTISGTTLTVSNVVGSIAVGDSISGVGVAPNTIITGFVGGTSYTVNNSLNVSSEAMTFNDNQSKDIAGTHFNDTFIGENYVQNVYYFVGQNLAAGTAPSDTFTGAQYGSNIAIFPDAISNYSISGVGSDGSFTVTNVGDPLHAGSLKISGTQSSGLFVPSVSVLEFGPSKDPNSNGVYEATAGTLYIASTLYNPVLIDSGATAEFSAFAALINGFNPEPIAFADTGGTLKLDAPSTSASITGSISGGTLTVTAVSAGGVTIGETITGSNIAANTVISDFVSGTNGGVGTYTVSNSQTVGSEALNLSSTAEIVLNARQAGASPFDFLDLANTSVASATVVGTTLTVNLIGGGTQIYEVVGQLGASSGSVSIPISSDGSGGSNLELTPVGSLWGTFTDPSQPTSGVHFYGANVQTASGSSNGDLLGLLYGYTASDYTAAGPDTVTSNLATFDPFFLPYASSVQSPQVGQLIATNTIPAGDFPGDSRQLLLVSVSATQTEGIGLYVTESNTGTATLNQFTFTEGTTNLNAPLTINNSLPPLESGLIGSGFEFFPGFTTNTTNGLFNNNNGTAGASYGVGWAQYNSTAQTLTADFQLFTPSGTPEFANPIQIFDDTGISSETAAPAWVFRQAGDSANSATITGTISSTTLTVANVSKGTIQIGQTIAGTGIVGSPSIIGFVSGTDGGAGTYTISAAQSVATGETLNLSGSTALYGVAQAELNNSGQDANAPANSDFIEFQNYNAVAINGLSAGAAFGTGFQITPNLSNFAPGATDQITQEAGSGDHTGVQLALFFTPNVAAGSGYSLAWNDTVTDSNGTHDQVEFAIYHPSSATLVTQQTFQIADGNAQNIRVLATTINGVNVELLAYGDANGTHIIEFDSSGNQLASIFDATQQTFSQFNPLGDGRVELLFDDPVDANGTTQYVTDVFDLRTAGLNINDSSLNDGKDKYIAGTQFNDTFVGESNVNNTYYYVGQNTTVGSGPTDSFTGGTGTAWNVAILPDDYSNYKITLNGVGAATLVNDGDPSHAGTLDLTNVQVLAFAPTVDPSGNSGTLTVTGDTLYILGSLPSNEVINFAAATGTLALAHPSAFTGEITGISGSGDVLDLTGFDTGATVSYSGNSSSGVVTVSEGANVVDLTITGTNIGTFVKAGLDSSGTGLLIHDPPAETGPIIIDSGATHEITSESAQNITFANTSSTTGNLVIDDPSGFSGQIAGFTGAAPDAAHSDTIDLVGINYNSGQFAETYNSASGLLTVTDGTNTANITFDNFDATFDFASDGNGGTLITDPPASGSSGAAASTPTDDWGMKFADDKVDHDTKFSMYQPNEAGSADGPKGVLVSAHSGNDTFAFHHELGAENATFSSHGDANDLANYHDVHLAQELATLVTPDPNHEAILQQIHIDALEPSGISSAQTQHAIYASHVLLH